jgi:transposase-like protein
MNPFGLAAALSRVVKITCPHCGYVKAAVRKPVAYRVCPRCHKHFPDPLAKTKRR